MKDEPSTGSRINVLSRDFVGHSYKPNPLIGSANTPEVFTASLDGFDCVTYLETKRSRARRRLMTSSNGCERFGMTKAVFDGNGEITI